MKRFVTYAGMIVGIVLFSSALLLAGGMGGGMGGGGMGGGGMSGGMMGNGGHMMDSFGRGQMGYDQQNRDSRSRDNATKAYRERRRAQEDYNRDMQRLERQIGSRQKALDAEKQKDAPDKSRIKKLRREISDLEQRYDDRQAEFRSQWPEDERP